VPARKKQKKGERGKMTKEAEKKEMPDIGTMTELGNISVDCYMHSNPSISVYIDSDNIYWLVLNDSSETLRTRITNINVIGYIKIDIDSYLSDIASLTLHNIYNASEADYFAWISKLPDNYSLNLTDYKELNKITTDKKGE
jgi:hypothetical protein